MRKYLIVKTEKKGLEKIMEKKNKKNYLYIYYIFFERI